MLARTRESVLRPDRGAMRYHSAIRGGTVLDGGGAAGGPADVAKIG